ncbi:ribonuclease P protein component [Helicobacter typhlonius]|uniref:Ribonuclease P protein component n=3 Tax=Helicobacter typhlonius TaxID=76936 RepID=A0A099UHX8_9HELI|nr:ribonuclease P protein component [Helicobacter typhlonius]TLD78573.1 ribonuclease P protein component [Helicobacter typhlonius]CUU40187.1 Ribonuclease P protein component [Helicobacter typhlonius]
MKLDSLKTKAEFDFIYKNARRFFHKSFVLYALRISHYKPKHFKDKRILEGIKSHQATLYLGLSISRKIGKANKRNLIKRRVRAIVYENRATFADFIFVFVAKEGITNVDFATLRADILFSFVKICEMYAKAPKAPMSRIES